MACLTVSARSLLSPVLEVEAFRRPWDVAKRTFETKKNEDENEEERSHHLTIQVLGSYVGRSSSVRQDGSINTY